jgi:hypothetical protein
MSPPRFYHDILHDYDLDVISSIETDSDDINTTSMRVDNATEEIQVTKLDSLIEATMAMESQPFEINRAQAISYLRQWGRLRIVEFTWEGVVIIRNQIASDYLRYKEMVGNDTGRCFHLKCDAIRKALNKVASEIRRDRKIKPRSEWKMDMLYRCIGKLTLHGHDHSDDETTQRSIRNCLAVEDILRSHTETPDWRAKDEMDERSQFWRRIYFAVPHCGCRQCVEETRETFSQGPR